MCELISRTLMLMAAILAFSAGAPTQAQHAGDIFVGLDGNRVITGEINQDQTIDTSVRAFRSTFGDSGFPGFTANPGYDAALVFNPSFRIGFNILSPLQYWNGTGDVSFAPAAGQTLTLSFLTLSATTGVCYVPGFDLAVQANGGWHRHLNMTLNPTAAAPGIYLLKKELYYTAPGFLDSRPFWIVFNHQSSEPAHLAALAWVNANLVTPACPADIDDSGTVNINDLLAVINAWGPACNTPVDVNDDSVVNIDDLLAVINAWGGCP